VRAKFLSRSLAGSHTVLFDVGRWDTLVVLKVVSCPPYATAVIRKE